MSRETLDIYVFNGNPKIRQERDDLIAELKAWAQSKLEAGTLPVALSRALLDVSHLAAGRGDEGEEFVLAFKRRAV